jgi:hypothetical protein
LLAPFRFNRTMTPAAPCPRIANFGSEILQAGLELEHAVSGWRDANFVRFAIEQEGKRVAVDFDGVGINGLAIKGDFPATPVAFKFDGA